MDENSVIFNDPSFSLYQANTYTLLLNIAAGSFGYAAVHDTQVMSCGLNLPLSEFTNPERLKELLASAFKNVVMGLPASALTLIPEKIFDYRHAADFARLLDVKEDEKVFIQSLDDKNIIMYKTGAALAKLADDLHVKTIVYNNCGWIKTIAGSSPPGNNLYIDINSANVTYLYFFLGELRYHNTFEFRNEAELVYYTSFVTSELKIKPRHTYLVLSGDVEAGDDKIGRLKEFYPNVSFNPLRSASLPDEVNAHKYLALTSLMLCGLSEEA